MKSLENYGYKKIYERTTGTGDHTQTTDQYEKSFDGYKILLETQVNFYGGMTIAQVIPDPPPKIQYDSNFRHLSKPTLQWFATGADIDEIEKQAAALVPHLHTATIRVV